MNLAYFAYKFLSTGLLLAFVPSIRLYSRFTGAYHEGIDQRFGVYPKKVVGGMVRVYDPSGAKLLEGKTDEKGAFTFKIPKRTNLRIVLETSMGHRAQFLLPAQEIKGLEEKPLLTDKIKDPDHVSPATLQGDMEQIRKMLEEVIDSRLRPITGKLAMLEKERGPRMTDIIGGIGYIFGLMGLVLYFKSRRERSKDEISGNG